MPHTVQTVFRVDDLLFNTEEEAEEYAKNINNALDEMYKIINTIKSIKEELRNRVKKEYNDSQTPENTCKCGNNDYSDKCLLHLCACNLTKEKYSDEVFKGYWCDHHTNMHFINDGCWYCRHSDCSRWYC